ncbi:hypothetical protein NSTC745_02879 [Nostoc sp. DSM 114161]|jgi:hypothetical protein|uniref:hypothetical protein n=1 Tax=Nostoc sp. DSM 114161 TaxID=3440143 RepID=UPI0040460DBC
MAIIRDVVLLNVVTFILGFLLAFAMPNSTLEEMMPTIALFNFVILTLSFLISGCVAKVNRFRHLRVVAILIWLGSIVNIYIVPGASLLTWLISSIPIAITMLIGGGLSFLVVPNTAATNASDKKEYKSAKSFKTWFFGFAASVATSVTTSVLKELIMNTIANQA